MTSLSKNKHFSEEVACYFKSWMLPHFPIEVGCYLKSHSDYLVGCVQHGILSVLIFPSQ